MDRPEFHRLADRELNEAAQYYDAEEPGLGAAFLQEIDRCLRSIETIPMPGRFSVVPFVVAFSVDFPMRSCTRSSPAAFAFSR